MQRIALLCLLLALTAACAPLTPPPTATLPPTATFIPTFTPTPTVTPTATPVPVWTIFKDNSDFLGALIKQDGKSAKHFSVENGKTYLAVTGSTGVIDQVEVNPDSAGVIVDADGHPLQVEDTGNERPLTIHGVGENADTVYSYIPETTITLNDKGETKTFPAHWAEVQKPKYTFDELHNPDGSWNIERLTEQINNPIRFTVEQVQNGELARSVLLSGYMQPVPDDVKFGGNALWHGVGEQFGPLTALLYSGGQHIPYFAVASVNGIDIGVRPFSIWNPKDQENPDRKQLAILNLGLGSDQLSGPINESYINYGFLPNRNPFILVQAEGIGEDGHKELNWIPRESRQALEGLPGNDPAEISAIHSTIQFMNNTAGQELWQTTNFYLPPDLAASFEQIVWLFYF